MLIGEVWAATRDKTIQYISVLEELGRKRRSDCCRLL